MAWKSALISVVVLVMLTGCTQKDNTSAAAADFNLRDLSGKAVKLSDFKGRPVLIDFWATWCPPCRESIPGLEKIHQTYSNKGLVVLGISLDQGGWDSVEAFVKEYQVTYQVLKGNDDVITGYQVRTIPMFVLIDKEGKIVKRYLGFDGEDMLERDISKLL